MNVPIGAAQVQTTGAPPFREGAGRLCLDFIRTLRHRGTAQATEELPDPEALAAWISQFGPFDDEPPFPSAAQVLQAQQLREAIHDLVTAAPLHATATRNLINTTAAHPVPAPALDASAHLHWHADDQVTALLSLLARDAIDLATSPALARVRHCANPDCRALFHDSSRPGTRRWCSMDRCGNQAKKQTLRAKRTPVTP